MTIISVSKVMILVIRVGGWGVFWRVSVENSCFSPFFANFPQKTPDFLAQYEPVSNLVNSGWTSIGK